MEAAWVGSDDVLLVGDVCVMSRRMFQHCSLTHSHSKVTLDIVKALLEGPGRLHCHLFAKSVLRVLCAIISDGSAVVVAGMKRQQQQVASGKTTSDMPDHDLAPLKPSSGLPLPIIVTLASAVVCFEVYASLECRLMPRDLPSSIQLCSLCEIAAAQNLAVIADAEHSRWLIRLARAFLFYSTVTLDHQSWKSAKLVQYEYRSAALRALTALASVESFTSEGVADRVRCVIRASFINYTLCERVRSISGE